MSVEVQAVEDWIHCESIPQPSIVQWAAWIEEHARLLRMCDGLRQLGSAPQVIDELLVGVAMLAALEGSSGERPKIEVRDADVAWRLDISSDGEATFEEFATWQESLFVNAAKHARARAGAARLDGHEVKIYRIERLTVDAVCEVQT